MNPDFPTSILSSGTTVMFRWLVWFTIAGTLLSLPEVNSSQLIYPALGITGIYLIFSTWVAYAFPLRRLKTSLIATRIGDILLLLDAATLGFVISLSDFAPISTLMLIGIVQFNCIMALGRYWSQCNLAMILGATPLTILNFREISPVIHTQSSLISTMGVVTYCSLIGYSLSNNYLVALGEIDALRTSLRKHKLRAYKLTQYVSPAVWKTVNEDNRDKPRTQRKPVTIFFSDIKDFSRLSEELEPETLTEILNTYLTEMVKIIRNFGGTIDKFMGDGIMVIFGDDEPRGKKEDALRCVEMALAMRRRMSVLQQVWINQGIKRPLQVRMGINTGYCTVGTFGTSHHLDYTALGTQVNLASRLESSASPGEILISHETWSMIKDMVMCRDRGEIAVRGVTHPVMVYSVIELRKNLGKNQTYFEKNLDGFSLHLDLDKINTEERDQLLRSLQEISEAVNEI